MKEIYLNTSVNTEGGVSKTFIKKTLAANNPTLIYKLDDQQKINKLSYINFRWSEEEQLYSNYIPTRLSGGYYDNMNANSIEISQFKNYINQIYTTNNDDICRCVRRTYDNGSFSSSEKSAKGITDDLNKMLVNKSWLMSANGTPISFLGMKIQVNFDEEQYIKLSNQTIYPLISDELFAGYIRLSYSGNQILCKEAASSNTTIKLYNRDNNTVLSSFILPTGCMLTSLVINITPVYDSINYTGGTYFYNKMNIDFAANYTYENDAKIHYTTSNISNPLYTMLKCPYEKLVPWNSVSLWVFILADK